jgi:hypothetical protein
MPEENYSRIQHFRTNVSGRTPALSAISEGELALNIADGNIFLKDVSNQIVSFYNNSYYENVMTLVRTNSAAWTVSSNSASWRTDYQGSSTYIGKALPNTSESSSSWFIKKITTNDLGQVISITSALNVSWNDRLNSTYN